MDAINTPDIIGAAMVLGCLIIITVGAMAYMLWQDKHDKKGG